MRLLVKLRSSTSLTLMLWGSDLSHDHFVNVYLMQLFFKDFTSLDQFTRSLEIHQSQTQCSHCFKHCQFVSHGIIYKQRSITEREPVGKRLFCSNRNGRSGCGRTVQLSIADCIPQLRYSAKCVSLFISLLLAHVGIGRAYQQATGQSETRNAWRWLSKLMQQPSVTTPAHLHVTDTSLLINTRSLSASWRLKTCKHRFILALFLPHCDQT